MALLVLGAAAPLGCNSAGPSDAGPPYIAIVTRIDAGPGVDPGAQYTYHIRELSGTIPIDTVITTLPTDTVILSVKPATYSVVLSGVPDKCQSKYGTDETILVPENTNTAIVRYFVTCKPLVSLEVMTEGAMPDDRYIYRLAGAGVERIGVANPIDTILLEDVPPGDYNLDIGDIAPNCTTIEAGAHRAVHLPLDGGVKISVRVACSDESRRPRMLDLKSSYHDGWNGFVFTVYDPDRDIERYVWDITDCQGESVIARGLRTRYDLDNDRAAYRDTVKVAAAFAVDLPELAGRCTAIRVADNNGNTTPIVEVPIRAGGSAEAPTASGFNAYLLGTSGIHTDLGAIGGVGGFAGVYAMIRARDGVLFAADGADDFGPFNLMGYLETVLPEIRLGGKLEYFDVRGIVVLLFDHAGNFGIFEDNDLSH